MSCCVPVVGGMSSYCTVGVTYRMNILIHSVSAYYTGVQYKQTLLGSDQSGKDLQ